MPKKYDISLTKLSNGNCVDDRIYPPLQEMFDEARRQGVNPIVREGYRTRDDQEEIMNNRIHKYISQGCSKKRQKARRMRKLQNREQVSMSSDLQWTLMQVTAQHLSRYITGCQRMPINTDLY